MASKHRLLASFSAVVSAVTAAVLLAGVFFTGASTAYADERPLVQRALIGAYVHLDGKPYRDPVAPEDLKALEDQIGKLDVVHYFFTWGRKFAEAVNSNATGRSIMLSMKPDGDLVSQIKNGAQDAY